MGTVAFRSGGRLKDIRAFIDGVFAHDLHAKRVNSLAYATLGAMTGATLAVTMMGQALAQARGLVTQHAIKQVDRLLSNQGIDIWDSFARWVPHLIGVRREIVVAMDWTDFAHDDQSTLALHLVTRLWLERRLHEALHIVDTDGRIAHLTGATSLDDRETLRRAFNADPAVEPLRILVCTDAAREGINLQARCYDLIHFDLPWNPAWIEQRNGRIDRKLQPAPKVFCRYFRYQQRAADIGLEALVRKMELIASQLGSAGQVLAAKISDDLDSTGINAADAEGQAKAIADADDSAAGDTAREELDDETNRRRTREGRNIDDLRRLLEQSRRRVGVDATELMRIAGVALGRMGTGLAASSAPELERTHLYTLDPTDRAFLGGTWAEAFDDLRVRRRRRNERLKDYRANTKIRRVAFAPAILPNGADAPDVVQLHLEHRLIRRLLARFTRQGFQDQLSRCRVVAGPGAQPRVILLGRLAFYGPGAARLHEEILPVTAIWQEATHGRSVSPLRPLLGCLTTD